MRINYAASRTPADCSRSRPAYEAFPRSHSKGNTAIEELFIHYGAADLHCSVATVKVAELRDHLLNSCRGT